MNDEMKEAPKTRYDIRHTRPVLSGVEGYSNVWLGGNLGDMPLLDRLEEIKAGDLVVLELSSFQLEQLAQSSYAPNLALITNLAPNHLDRHGTFENYCRAKENIFSLQGPSAARRHQNHPGETQPPVSIFNADDPLTMQWYEKYKNDAGRVCLTFSRSRVGPALRDSFALPGRANLENLAAAIAIAEYFGAEQEELKEAVATFKSLPHRLELVAEINGTRWYNDSVSTTPESSIVALESFSQSKVIIAGGYDKGVSFEELGRQIAQKAKAAVLIGKTSGKIAEAVQKGISAKEQKGISAKEQKGVRAKVSDELSCQIKFADSMAEAVTLAGKLAGPGEVVLLSPGCASYDMFDDFRHRGEVFKECVKKISHNPDVSG